MSETKHGVATKICPQCGYEGKPMDALFLLNSAAMLIPMTVLSLRKFLSRHKDQFPPLYHYGSLRRRHRLLTGDEIRQIRITLAAGPKRRGFDHLWRRIMVFANDKGNEGKEFVA